MKQQRREIMISSRSGPSVMLVIIALLLTVGACQTRGGRTARLEFPAEGQTVEGPNVTFRVKASGVRLPDEHFHLLIDNAARQYVPGTAIPTGRVDMVHFRAETTTVRMTPGPHFVVLIATDNNHVPLQPWTGESRYFAVR